MPPLLRILTAALFCVLCVAITRAADPLEIKILGSGYVQPMEMSIAADGRIFVAERPGKVKLIDPAKPGASATLIDLKTDTRCESGLIGLALDPNFETNGWIWLYHTVRIDDNAYHEHHLGRFTYADGKIDPKSEKVLLKVRASFEKRIHEAGSIGFDADGLLYLSTGDNQIRSENLFSCKTAANSNDLRGKILRIRPKADGTYEIPKGNLFPPGTPKTLPEIYVMGLRNPFRIAVDKKTGWVLWGENGPPNHWSGNTKIDKKLLPLGYDEFNIAQKASFRGYPMIIANQQSFVNYDFKAKKVGPKFDPNAPVNTHPGNTGISKLPPSDPPLIWYEGLQKEFPQLGKGGESAIGGPIFRSSEYASSKGRLPDTFDNCWLIGEYSRRWIKAVKLDDQGTLQEIKDVLPPLRLGRPTNLKLGPKGRLHVMYFGMSKNATNGSVIRLERSGTVAGTVPIKSMLGTDKAPKGLNKKDPGLVAMQNSDCMSCHQWKAASIGPPLTTISIRYSVEKDPGPKLIDKILKGGTGVWGNVPMLPHPQHTKKQAATMVKTILSLHELDKKNKKNKKK
jgi:cytochrome c